MKWLSSLRRASGDTSHGYSVIKVGWSNCSSAVASKISQRYLPAPQIPSTSGSLICNCLAMALSSSKCASGSFIAAAFASGQYFKIASPIDKRWNG